MNPHDATEQAFNNGKIKGAREFAERLKAKSKKTEIVCSGALVTISYSISKKKLDNLLKEMERDSSAGS